MKTIIGIIIIITLAAGGYYFYNTKSEPLPSGNGGAAGTMLPGSEVPDGLVGGDAVAPEGEEGVTSYTVLGSNYEFSPSNLTAKKGDTVRITFRTSSGFHDFVLDAFDVRTQQLSEGKEEMIEFVVDKTGTFEFYCSVGDHRERGMVGTLTVTE